MRALGRRGYTLVELLIALVLLGIVSGAIYQVLVNNQRVYQAQTQQIDLQQNLRAATTVLPAEFRELDAADGDIQMMTATAIQIRAMRKIGFLCLAPALAVGLGTFTMNMWQQPMYGRNTPFAAGDSVLVFFEGSATRRDDDQWLPVKISGVSNFQCPDAQPAGGTPGYQLATSPPGWLNNPALAVNGAISKGSPVRGFEVVRYQVYQSASDGKWYVGYQNISAGGFASIQPLIGPLTGSTGFELDYFDVNGAVTTDSSKVALIEIHLRAQTAAPVRSGGALGTLANKVDSITTRVALRNNPRCGTGSAPFARC
jgi:prepilin-type N-terminal cleavage/methylation domain-containing protein